MQNHHIHRVLFLLLCLFPPQLVAVEPEDELVDVSCTQAVEAEAEEDQTSAQVLPAFEAQYPMHETSLRGKFPKLYRQIMDLFLQSPTIYGFAGDAIGVPATVLMDRMRDGSNSTAKGLQKVLRKLEKDIAASSRNVNRSVSRRGSNDRAGLRDQLKDLEKMRAIMALAARHFHLGPVDVKTNFDVDDRRKWALFERQRELLDGRLFPAGVALDEWFPDLGNDYRWSWDLLRSALCVPQIDRLQIRYSELGLVGKTQAQTSSDSYLPLKFLDTNGKNALGLIRIYARPVLLHSKEWRKTMEEVRECQAIGMMKLFKVHLFFISGIDTDAKQALEAMGFSVQGPLHSAVGGPNPRP